MNRQVSLQRNILPATLNLHELDALKWDLIAYLRSEIKQKMEKYFLENCLKKVYDLELGEPKNIRYET